MTCMATANEAQPAPKLPALRRAMEEKLQHISLRWIPSWIFAGYMDLFYSPQKLLLIPVPGLVIIWHHCIVQLEILGIFKIKLVPAYVTALLPVLLIRWPHRLIVLAPRELVEEKLENCVTLLYWIHFKPRWVTQLRKISPLVAMKYLSTLCRRW